MQVILEVFMTRVVLCLIVLSLLCSGKLALCQDANPPIFRTAEILALRNNPQSFLVPIKEGTFQVWVHSGPELIPREMCEE
jgi:hypothetical protein